MTDDSIVFSGIFDGATSKLTPCTIFIRPRPATFGEVCFYQQVTGQGQREDIPLAQDEIPAFLLKSEQPADTRMVDYDYR